MRLTNLAIRDWQAMRKGGGKPAEHPIGMKLLLSAHDVQGSLPFGQAAPICRARVHARRWLDHLASTHAMAQSIAAPCVGCPKTRTRALGEKQELVDFAVSNTAHTRPHLESTAIY